MILAQVRLRISWLGLLFPVGDKVDVELVHLSQSLAHGRRPEFDWIGSCLTGLDWIGLGWT